MEKKYQDFEAGASVQWDYHAGSAHHTRTGTIIGFLKAGASASRLAKKNKLTFNKDASFGDTSTNDRYLITSVDNGKVKFFAPKATLVVPQGSRKTPVARHPEAEVAEAKDNTNTTEPAVTLALGDPMPEASKYTFIGGSDSVNVFARPCGYGIKFMFTGPDSPGLSFTRPSHVRPAKTASIIGLAFKDKFGIGRDSNPYPDEVPAYLAFIAEAFSGLGLTVSMELLKFMVSTRNDEPVPRTMVGILTSK